MRTENFKRQSYSRLLKYAMKYKGHLAIGIIAGILAGGSLGLSFFWLKGFITPFQNQKTPYSHTQVVSTQAKSIAQQQPAQTIIPNAPKNIEGTGAKKSSKVSGGQTGQIDAILKIAGNYGINTVGKNGDLTFLGMLLFAVSFLLVWMLKSVATFVNRYFMRWVGVRVVADLRSQLFRKLMDQSLLFYGKADVGQLISRCTQDTAQIQQAVSNSVADAIRCPFEILGCLSFIIYVSIQNNNVVLPVILVVGAVVILFPLMLVGRRVRKVYKYAFQKVAEVVSRMHEVFTAIVLVKAYDAEKVETKTFIDINESYFNSLVKALKPELLMRPLMEFVISAGVVAFVVYSFANHVSLSDIIVLVVPATMAYQPIRSLAKVNTYIQRSMAAADRYFDLIDTDTSLKEIENPVSLNGFNDAVRFEDVSFSYEGEKMVLKNIDFPLKKGNMVAVVGETGSGKSTIANLIARFYDVSSGKVTVDGHDVRDMRISELRELVGIVTQDAILFNDTIANNIAYGTPGATREMIIEAAKQANAHRFIVGGNHAEGYDTIVGEKGFKLSGGEKQRVAIARAILKNPPILILDEATSALDTVTEKLVQEALNNLMENRTVFAIAHRLSTIKHADTILVLADGEIVEKGTHDELMAMMNGKYRKLHEIQFEVH